MGVWVRTIVFFSLKRSSSLFRFFLLSNTGLSLSVTHTYCVYTSKFIMSQDPQRAILFRAQSRAVSPWRHIYRNSLFFVVAIFAVVFLSNPTTNFLGLSMKFSTAFILVRFLFFNSSLFKNTRIDRTLGMSLTDCGWVCTLECSLGKAVWMLTKLLELTSLSDLSGSSIVQPTLWYVLNIYLSRATSVSLPSSFPWKVIKSHKINTILTTLLSHLDITMKYSRSK